MIDKKLAKNLHAIILNEYENTEGIVILKAGEIIFEEYVSKLKDRDKQIFILFSEGYKQGEISRIVGCSQSQVSRVRKKLCKYLARSR